MKGVGRRRTLLFDDFRNRRGYWELKEEAEDRRTLKRHCFHKSMDLLISSKLLLYIHTD
jgi:hypothetical protein